MSVKIIEKLDESHFGAGCEFWNCYDDTFIRRDQVKLHRYAGSLLLMDISDAMRPGKVCEKFSLNWWPHDGSVRGVDELFRAHGFYLRAVLATLRALPWQKQKHWKTGAPTDDWQQMTGAELAAAIPAFAGNENLQLSLHRGENQAIRIWSPFASVKPLPAAPKKWTVAHVVRALMAGQAVNLKCNGVYSDDYAYDAAVNFHQGPIKNAVAFARRIMESPSGWWAMERGGWISICCHSFDSNEFQFDLTGKGAK